MSEPLLVRAARLEPTERTPVWFMRQAGRSLPEYREIRKSHTLFEVCYEPELCAEVTLQPVRRHDVDAAVMFADIMLPLLGMGVNVELVENVGPVIEQPIRSLADVERLDVPEPEESVPFILEAVSIVRRELRPDQAVIGFCGGPFTVAGYLIEGKPSREFLNVKRMMYAEPETWHALMEKLTDAFSLYVAAKVRAGADVIQLFDSWVGALSPQDYEEFVQPYSARILAAVDCPTIHFGTGTATLLEADARRGRRRDRARLADPARLGLAAGRRRPRRAGQPRRSHSLRAVGADRGRDPRRARPRGRPAGAHLQPRPRRHARYRSGRARPPAGVRARADGARPGMSTAVVLMAYGSPDRLEDVPAYYADIRGGRPISPENLEDLVARYRRLGIEDSNPLNEITEATRAALEVELGIPVFTGMRHWQPRIAAAVERALAGGADELVGLVLAPHYSSMSIERYRAQLVDAVAGRAEIRFVERWGAEPGFVDLIADRVAGAEAHVVFTAHSLPARILDDGDPYKNELLETSRLVAEKAGVAEWSFSFQSESPTGEPWLGPDILDHLEALAARGVSEVLVAPVGFVADHLEIRWDIDVEAQERATELGLWLDRIELPNTDPAFIRVLAGLVRRAAAVPLSA